LYFKLAVSVVAKCTVKIVLREGTQRKTKKEGTKMCVEKQPDSCSGVAVFSFCIMA
jgi:hypothetical protein